MGNGRCLYPGSFDPVTNGHMDIISRAAAIFDELVVGVLHNPEKHGLFTPAERVAMLKKACEPFANVRIIQYGGLLVELTKEMDIHVVVRGIRGVTDMESEVAMARANRILSPDIETVFLPATPMTGAISASLVRQIAQFGGDISGFVPAQVLSDVENRFAMQTKEDQSWKTNC